MRYEASSLNRNISFQVPPFIGTTMLFHASLFAATGWASELDWIISGVFVFVVMVVIFVIASPRQSRQSRHRRRSGWTKPRRRVRKTHV